MESLWDLLIERILVRINPYVTIEMRNVQGGQAFEKLVEQTATYTLSKAIPININVNECCGSRETAETATESGTAFSQSESKNVLWSCAGSVDWRVSFNCNNEWI
jgi:hypothetical protein